MIRQFQAADAEACSKLICDCLQNDLSLSPPLRQKMLEQETPEMMLKRAGLFYIAVYESEDRILGIAGIDMNEIRLLYVSPESQRRGIGRMLWDHIRPMAPSALSQTFSSIPPCRLSVFTKPADSPKRAPIILILPESASPQYFYPFLLHK
jgi:GNAT superfamily N-acetyltransferase